VTGYPRYVETCPFVLGPKYTAVFGFSNTIKPQVERELKSLSAQTLVLPLGLDSW
jgi:hypothetical protein